MRTTDQLISVRSALQDAGAAQSSLAIVSPCSTCVNYRAVDDADGLPACPRRYWQKRADDMQSQGYTDGLPAAYLLRKARDPKAAGLENPVQWPEGNTRLVWIATLEDNRAVDPDLLTPGFDTNTIQCRPMPYLPASREADYYAGGQFKENDVLLVHSFVNEQIDASAGDWLRMGGVAQKITPMQKATITPPSLSVNPRGM